MAKVLNAFALDNPDDILQQKNDDIQQGLAGNATQRGAALGSLFSRFAFGDPQVDKARAEQTANQTAQQNLEPQGSNESDIDYQIRQTHAMYQAVAPIDANAAQKVADHIVSLQQAKQQQALISSEVKGRQDDDLIKQQTQGTFVVGSPDGTKEFGSVSRFLPDGTPNPDFSSQLAALQQQNPGSQVATQQQWFANRAAIATEKAASQQQLALIREQLKQGNQSPEDIKYLAGMYAFNNNALARQTPEVRMAAIHALRVSGITYADQIQAQTQIKALQAAAKAEGSRVGNVDFLHNSIKGLGDQVLLTAQGLDRTNIMAINSAIASGKSEFSNPAEKRYALAVQALVTEYARALSGGTGVTTDTARDEAHSYLSVADGIPAMKAAIDQIVNGEIVKLQDAGDETLEMIGKNTRRYSAVQKIQQKLGIGVGEVAPPGSTEDSLFTVPDVSGKTPGAATVAPGGVAPSKPLGKRIDSILGGQ